MKRIIFCIIFFLLITNPIFSQFKLTINGFVNYEDNNKNYVVANIEEHSKEVLYSNVLRYLTQVYSSPKEVLSTMENEVITVNAIQPKQIPCKTLKYDIHYSFSISFRDGRMRFDSPAFTCKTFYSNKPYLLVMTGGNSGFGNEVKIGLFKKDGKRAQEKTIESIELFFNSFFSNICSAAEGSEISSNDDW